MGKASLQYKNFTDHYCRQRVKVFEGTLNSSVIRFISTACKIEWSKGNVAN